MTHSKNSTTAKIRAEVEARFDNYAATKQDELMLALFHENHEQRATILALTLKLSMCENLAAPVEVSLELQSIMYGGKVKVVKVRHDA